MSKKPILSGFCESGFHEATKAVTWNKKPAAICVSWESCGCACHIKITKMYADLGLPREEAIQNPEYLKVLEEERQQFQLPDPLAPSGLAPLFNAGGGILPPPVESAVGTSGDSVLATPTPPAPAVVAARFGPTPTGRRARGQLEYEVLSICVEFVEGVYDWELCTPKLVSERIATLRAIEPPSTGAIDAVWNRWEELGFAVRAKKPSSFVEFVGTEPVSVERLERMKFAKKQARKRGQAEQRRGIPRPVERRKR